MKKRFRFLVCMIVTLSLPRLAFPWGDTGHQIVGDIAEKTINAETKTFIRGILGVEPFSVAATWPDHVRDDKRRFGHVEPDPLQRDADNHDFAPYHFCEIPTGFTYETRPRVVVKDCHGAILNAEELLKGASATREEKMIALRYLMHIVGDIHQPLHVGNGYDRGGNACQVKWAKVQGETPVQQNLHLFWDTSIVEYLGASYADESTHHSSARYYSEYVTVLQRKYPDMFSAAGKQRYGAGSVSQWLMEGKDLREAGLYPDDPAAMRNVPSGEEYKHRPYCLWFVDQTRDLNPATGSRIDEARIPLLSRTYADRYLPVAETQLLKGGLRLAFLLDQIAAGAAAPGGVDDDQEARVLQTVQDALRRPIPLSPRKSK